MALALCLAALTHFLYQHYQFRWPLVRPTARSVTALVAYELGYYKEASRLWRTTAKLDHDRAALPGLVDGLSAAIAQNPNNVDDYLSLADAYIAAGDYGHAGAAYEEARRRQPKLADPEIGLATIALFERRYSDARAHLDAIFNVGSTEKSLATFLNFLAALDALARAPGPVDADRYLTLAYAYRYLGIFDPRQYRAVVGYAMRAVQLDGRLDAAYFCAGVAYTKQEKIDLAIEQFRAAVAVNPENAEAYRRLGSLYGRRGNPAEELAAYERAVELEPRNPVYAYEFAVMLRQKYGDLKQATNYARRAYELDPDRYTYAIELGYTLAELQHCDDALVLYGAAAHINPRLAEPWYYEGICLVRLDRYADAVAAFRRAETLGTLPSMAAHQLGLAYRRLNRLDDAIATYEAAVRIRPNDIEMLDQLQVTYRRVGRYADAYRAVRQMLTLQPHHPGALRVLPYLQANVQG